MYLLAKQKYSAKKVLRNANKTAKNFKNLQTKARVTVTDKGRDKSNNLNIRISKDQKSGQRHWVLCVFL